MADKKPVPKYFKGDILIPSEDVNKNALFDFSEIRIEGFSPVEPGMYLISDMTVSNTAPIFREQKWVEKHFMLRADVGGNMLDANLLYTRPERDLIHRPFSAKYARSLSDSAQKGHITPNLCDLYDDIAAAARQGKTWAIYYLPDGDNSEFLVAAKGFLRSDGFKVEVLTNFSDDPIQHKLLSIRIKWDDNGDS